MSIGLIWYLAQKFSINIIPWYMAVCFLPHLLMSFHSVHVIKRLGVLNTVIASEFFRAIVLLSLYSLLGMRSLDGDKLLTALFVSGFLVGLGSSLFTPAILSLPPKLVNEEKVMGLNALIDTSLSISTILGAMFAIFILNFVDFKTLILINGLSFLWAGFLQLGIKIKPNEDERKEWDEEKSIGTMEVLRKYPEIANMLGSFLFLNLVFTPLLVMIPWFVQNKYLGDASSLAMIEGSMGLGAFLTGLYLSIASFRVKDEKRMTMIAFVSFLFGVFLLLFAYSQFSWQGAGILFAVGAISTFLNIQVLTYFQSATLAHELPAVMSAVNIISAATIPLSFGFSGLLFPHVYMPNFAKLSGCIVIVIALAMPKFLKGSLWKI